MGFKDEQKRDLVPRRQKLYCAVLFHVWGSNADVVLMEGNEQFLLSSHREVVFYGMGYWKENSRC